MTELTHTASVSSSSALKFASSGPPLSDAARHDEWLLDEALAETFPASDSIAVSPRSRASDKRACPMQMRAPPEYEARGAQAIKRVAR